MNPDDPGEATDPGDATGAQAPDAAPGLARATTILVVDDEPDILESFKDLLEQSMPGIRVVVASSGAEGLGILTSQPIDLVMADFRMPGMNGLDFLVEARLLRPTLPRIMFTAFADDELAQEALSKAVVDGFVSKNIEPADMIRKVAALLDYPLPPGAWE